MVTAATGRARSTVKRVAAKRTAVVEKSAPKKSATKAPTKRARKKSPSVAIRAWANANGIPVGLKGVVRKEVVDAYNAATK